MCVPLQSLILIRKSILNVKYKYLFSPFFQSKSVFEDMQQHADSYLLSLTIGGTGNFHMQICWA